MLTHQPSGPIKAERVSTRAKHRSLLQEKRAVATTQTWASARLVGVRMRVMNAEG